MTALFSYQSVEDAWQGGVAEWCREASPFVLSGGQAWLVVAGEEQANWIKQRLLKEGTGIFGVHFLDVRALRRELCLKAGFAPPALGRDTLEFLLRLHALNPPTPDREWAAVARHPGACLKALDDLAAAGWLEEVGMVDDVLPASMNGWLPELRASGSWTPHCDERLAEHFRRQVAPNRRLSLCVFGWDASFWQQFNLLTAGCAAAGAAYLFLPSPRGTSEALQQAWLEACENRFQAERQDCEPGASACRQAALAEKLEGTSLDGAETDGLPEPELLTGRTIQDTAALVCGCVARWLLKTQAEGAAESATQVDRIVLLGPGRTPGVVATVRALAEAGIAVEDAWGEVPEPSLGVQIQRALLDYHLDRAGLDQLLNAIELLNEHRAVWSGSEAWALHSIFPLDPVDARRVLHRAFAEVQTHSARVMAHAIAAMQSPAAVPLRRLIEHLGEWPEFVPWTKALERWAACLVGLGLDTETLEPLWSRLKELQVSAPVASAAFFRYLGAALRGVPVRREPATAQRFARVVVTSLEGAAGQTWGGAILLDANEGSWPLYPPENTFLSDASRRLLNVRRAEADGGSDEAPRGHLFTASDHSQLEYFRFLEVLQNCRGPLAFAASATDPGDPNKELYPNEWLLRCLVETGKPKGESSLLDRWRQSIRVVAPAPPKLAAREQTHLRQVHERRRDGSVPFDEYLFNFVALTGPDALPWADPWSAGELEAAWTRPATFALQQVFGVERWTDMAQSLTRGEGWMVGRLVHRWLQTALGVRDEPRRFEAADWHRAQRQGLPEARSETEARLRLSLARRPDGIGVEDAPAPLPLWWRSTLGKAYWAAQRCLDALREAAQAQAPTPVWIAMNRQLKADLLTPEGPLRVQARCDVLLLDRPEFEGATCQILDIRTGSAQDGSLSANQLEQGKGLNLATSLLLASAQGVNLGPSHAGTVHPDASNPSQASQETTVLVQPALTRLARQQRTLFFGQSGLHTSGHDQASAEVLPLATTPIEPAILAAKGAASIR